MKQCPIKVLLVEDDEEDFLIIRDMLRSGATRSTFELEWVGTYEAAGERARQEYYDVCLLDYRLGERNGIQLLKELLENNVAVPVILLTGQGDYEVDAEAMISGASDYLDKGEVTPHILERSIRYAIQESRTLEALRSSELRFREIFEGSPLGIALVNSEGRILVSNYALERICARERVDLANCRLDSLLHPDEMKTCSILRTLSVADKVLHHAECRLVRSDGQSIWCKMTISHPYRPQAEEAGAPHYVVMLEDITEQRETHEALRESERQLRILSSKLFEAQENERRAIARELHDSVGGSLTAIKYSLEGELNKLLEGGGASAASMESILSVVQRTIEETRRLSSSLRPSVLDDLGVLATISWSCREFEKIYPNIRIEKRIDVQEQEIPESLKTPIYRIMQEALNNAAKYSGAGLVRLSLGKSDDSIALSIQDDGPGIDPSRLSDNSGERGGMGLSSMEERAELSGGIFSIESAPGAGTKVLATWPTARPEEPETQ